jgi:DNA-binding NarL/FixJ family response regulator
MKYQIIHAERDFRYHEKLKNALLPYPQFNFIDHCCYLDNVLQLLDKYLPTILLTASKLFDEAGVVEAFCHYRDVSMPQLKIIVLTSKDSMDHFLNSMIAGVDGYIAKSSSIEEIHECLQTVMDGDNYLGLQKQIINHE